MTNTQRKSNQKPTVEAMPWRGIVLEVLSTFAGQQVPTATIFGAVCAHPFAKERLATNKNVRAKVRQVVNGLADRGVVKRVGVGRFEVPTDIRATQ